MFFPSAIHLVIQLGLPPIITILQLMAQFEFESPIGERREMALLIKSHSTEVYNHYIFCRKQIKRVR